MQDLTLEFLMTFVGNTKESSGDSVVYGLFAFAFAVGVLFGATATFFGYLSQNEFMRQINENEPMNDDVLQKNAAIKLCGFSYGCFAFNLRGQVLHSASWVLIPN
jgi:hypothetical protein